MVPSRPWEVWDKQARPRPVPGLAHRRQTEREVLEPTGPEVISRGKACKSFAFAWQRRTLLKPPVMIEADAQRVLARALPFVTTPGNWFPSSFTLALYVRMLRPNTLAEWSIYRCCSKDTSSLHPIEAAL